LQEVLNKLEQVQELDTQIHSILKKTAEFPQRLAGYETEIAAATEKFETKKKIVDELEKNKRQQLGALELNEERAKRNQEKLEAVKTNQEYQALQKELEGLKKNSAVIKENADKASAELETYKTEIATIEAVLNDNTTKRDAEAAKIAEEQKDFDTELARLNALRAKAIVGVDARYLLSYDRVRMGRGGLGLAPVISGTCRGCNMRIPPQTYNELRRGTEIHVCPSCKRILVYKDTPKAGVESATR
jgi:predicted  nucleic acid-binding Zn-ribbon protein